MKQLLTLFSVSTLASVAWGGTIFLGGYPDSILVVDEAQGKVVDKIHLETGLPMSLRLSDDKKKIFVTTNDHSGVEVIDVASRKVLSHFVLNTATKHYRFNGGTPDPQGKLFYTVTIEIDKQLEHYDIGKRKTRVSTLNSKKSSKTLKFPRRMKIR